MMELQNPQHWKTIVIPLPSSYAAYIFFFHGAHHSQFINITNRSKSNLIIMCISQTLLGYPYLKKNCHLSLFSLHPGMYTNCIGLPGMKKHVAQCDTVTQGGGARQLVLKRRQRGCYREVAREHGWLCIHAWEGVKSMCRPSHFVLNGQTNSVSLNWVSTTFALVKHFFFQQRFY